MGFYDPDTVGMVSPREMVKAFTTFRGVREENLSLPSSAIITFSLRMLNDLVRVADGNAFESWYGRNTRLFQAKVGDYPIVLTMAPHGAPSAVILLEELIAFGVERAVFVGYCGSIQDRVRLGEIVLPIDTVREEGTSYHYVPVEAPCRPDGMLLNSLDQSLHRVGLPTNKGAVWTTDALYRETKDKVGRYRANGVLGVDMETAALYAVGAVRKVPVVCLLLVSDLFSCGVWTPGFFDSVLVEREYVLAGALVEWIREVCGSS